MSDEIRAGDRVYYVDDSGVEREAWVDSRILSSGELLISYHVQRVVWVNPSEVSKVRTKDDE